MPQTTGVFGNQRSNLRYDNVSGVNITTSNNTVAGFSTASYDDNGDWNPIPGIFTAPFAGKYLFCFHLQSVTTLPASDQWFVRAYKNSAIVVAMDVKAGTGAANTYNSVQVSGEVYLNKNDTLQFNSNTGATLVTLDASAGACFVTISKISD